MRETLTRWRYRYWPDHVLGEILAKRWMETAIPVIVLLIVGSRWPGDPELPVAGEPRRHGRQAGEIGFIVLGMALVMIVGGIDLSVGSMFALTNFCALLPDARAEVVGRAAVAVTLLCGAVLGAVNGVLIGYFRLRAFLTTLITLIIYRASYDLLIRRLLDGDRRRPFPNSRRGTSSATATGSACRQSSSSISRSRSSATSS